jgi:hypothetical protein
MRRLEAHLQGVVRAKGALLGGRGRAHPRLCSGRPATVGLPLLLLLRGAAVVIGHCAAAGLRRQAAVACTGLGRQPGVLLRVVQRRAAVQLGARIVACGARVLLPRLRAARRVVAALLLLGRARRQGGCAVGRRVAVLRLPLGRREARVGDARLLVVRRLLVLLLVLVLVLLVLLLVLVLVLLQVGGFLGVREAPEPPQRQGLGALGAEHAAQGQRQGLGVAVRPGAQLRGC